MPQTLEERQLIAAAQIDPPDHITAVLGPRPDSYLHRPAWERAVAAIETYRHRHNIPPDHDQSALGPAPERIRPTMDFRETERAVRHARVQLGLEPDITGPHRTALADRLSEPPPRDPQRLRPEFEGVGQLRRSTDRAPNP